MDKTTLNAQLFITGLKRHFLSPQICWLRKIRSVEKFWLLMKRMTGLILLLV